MAHRCQGKVREEKQRGEARHAAGEEILVVEPPDTAVEEKVVVVTPDDAAFAHVAVERPCWHVLAAVGTGIPVAGLGFFLRLNLFLLFGIHKQRDLIFLLGWLCVTEAVQLRPLVCLGRQETPSETPRKPTNSHLVETENCDENQQNEHKVLLRQKLQQRHKELEQSQQVQARSNHENQEEVRPATILPSIHRILLQSLQPHLEFFFAQ
jgi:hypothetical protein